MNFLYFACFCEFHSISWIYIKFVAPQPCEILEALLRGLSLTEALLIGSRGG